MKSNNTFKTLVLPGVLAALLLAGCGGGGTSTDSGSSGGGGTSSDTSSVVELPSFFVITSTDAVTASVKVNNTAGVLNGVQVLVSTLKTAEATSDDATSATIKDIALYNSSEDATSAQSIAASGSATFSLKNVSFAAASADVGSSASDATCTNVTDTVLGEVRLEVFGDGWLLKELDVPVCALQGKTYEVSVSN